MSKIIKTNLDNVSLTENNISRYNLFLQNKLKYKINNCVHERHGVKLFSLSPIPSSPIFCILQMGAGQSFINHNLEIDLIPALLFFSLSVCLSVCTVCTGKSLHMWKGWYRWCSCQSTVELAADAKSTPSFSSDLVIVRSMM